MAERIDVGFTGTRKGMTAAQQDAIRALLDVHPEWNPVHHGGCVGADAEMHVITRHANRDVVVHRSTHSLAAELIVDDRVVERPAIPPLDRNRVIVDESAMLIATPAGMSEERRSGTWMTVRHARRNGTPVIVCWPDGTVSHLNSL